MSAKICPLATPCRECVAASTVGGPDAGDCCALDQPEWDDEPTQPQPRAARAVPRVSYPDGVVPRNAWEALSRCAYGVHAADWASADYDSVRGALSTDPGRVAFRVPCAYCPAVGSATVEIVGGAEQVDWSER